jgi:hypothetical protein
MPKGTSFAGARKYERIEGRKDIHLTQPGEHPTRHHCCAAVLRTGLPLIVLRRAALSSSVLVQGTRVVSDTLGSIPRLPQGIPSERFGMEGSYGSHPAA